MMKKITIVAQLDKARESMPSSRQSFQKPATKECLDPNSMQNKGLLGSCYRLWAVMLHTSGVPKCRFLIMVKGKFLC